MKFLIVCMIVIAGLALAAPPQVKMVSHTYSETRVEFWYPTVIEDDKGLRISDGVTVRAFGGGYWNRDRLRSTNFLCGSNACADGVNPISKEWRENNEIVEKINLEVSAYREKIVKNKAEEGELERYVESNQCAQIIVGPIKPQFACSNEEVDEVATTLCTIREFGSKLCEKGGKEVIDFEAPKFFKDAMAREGCAAAVYEVIGEEYNILDKTINKYTTDLPLTIISEVLGSFWKSGKEAFDWSVTLAKTKNCLPSGAEICKRKFAAWQVAVANHFSIYSENVKNCVAANEKISSVKAEISRNQDHVSAGERLVAERVQRKRELEMDKRNYTYPNLLQAM